MTENARQLNEWAGDFGRGYTDRNLYDPAQLDSFYLQRYGIGRRELNERFLSGFDNKTRILEIGANAGNQLLCLQNMGFTDLSGIEVLDYALGLARTRVKGCRLEPASAFDIPFSDADFGLVFTSGVLIHIAPSLITGALKEIYRVSNRYIWGFEYYAPSYTEVAYRGKSEMLWKTDFAKLYLDLFPRLRLIKEERITHLDGSGNVDSMFMLEKS